jgi:hypothetical protein
MDPLFRIASGFVAALILPMLATAAGEPPPATIDLGAMKLKRANAPATTQAAVPPGTPAPTSLPAVQRTSVLPAGTNAATPAPAQAAANQPANTNAAQNGIGNVVQTPLKNRATDVLNTNANKPDDRNQQSSNDVQVKMPSMFRRP